MHSNGFLDKIYSRLITIVQSSLSQVIFTNIYLLLKYIRITIFNAYNLAEKAQNCMHANLNKHLHRLAQWRDADLQNFC